MSGNRRHFWTGALQGAPFLIVVVPFGALFGVVATEAGLNLYQVLGFSIAVTAGAAQFTAIQLMLDEAPTFIVLLSALAVNLRMAMYSAALVPHLGQAPLWTRAFLSYFLVDQSYALADTRFNEKLSLTLAEKLAFFFGVAAVICPFWYLSTLLGAVLGTQIPDAWALDFAVPITFIALVAPLLRSVPHLAAAFVSVVLSLCLWFVPYNLWLIIAATVAMITGAEVERQLDRRRKS